MWRNSSFLIAKECKQSFSPKCLRRVTKTDVISNISYLCGKHSTFIKTSEIGCLIKSVENVIPLSRSTHIDVTTTKKTNLLRNSVKEADKKTVDMNKEMIQDKDIEPALKAVTNEPLTLSSYSETVPGKGPPPEPPIDCCMSGCVNCVWIKFAEELRDYYAADGNERAKKEIEKIDNPSLKAFIKLELGLL